MSGQQLSAEVRDLDGALVAIDQIECQRCYRALPGLLVRVANGVCASCERDGGAGHA
ncbi:hypothetical protein [Gordonia sp. NB41Y]|uniref:hypothetical protein n=1 Tax=Gordonia sp. NB41Y TaxID=875808 RepID=UPI0002BFDB9D|nr:hypothetical protein [Gordonia sp. NB41Y]WLP91343.1 hypothetical protein Q9K23_03465 [Gordonia sp. NB41Y]